VRPALRFSVERAQSHPILLAIAGKNITRERDSSLHSGRLIASGP
jgi:hypothetical protein